MKKQENFHLHKEHFALDQSEEIERMRSEGKSFQEIGEKLNRTTKAVYNHFHTKLRVKYNHAPPTEEEKDRLLRILQENPGKK